MEGPNVNRSGKLHHLHVKILGVYDGYQPPAVAEPGVPNVNRSGKLHHTK